MRLPLTVTVSIVLVTVSCLAVVEVCSVCLNSEQELKIVREIAATASVLRFIINFLLKGSVSASFALLGVKYAIIKCKNGRDTSLNQQPQNYQIPTGWFLFVLIS